MHLLVCIHIFFLNCIFIVIPYVPFGLFAYQIGDISSGDPSVVEPCVAVLRKLSNELYSGLTAEMQVSLLVMLEYISSAFLKGHVCMHSVKNNHIIV